MLRKTILPLTIRGRASGGATGAIKSGKGGKTNGSPVRGSTPWPAGALFVRAGSAGVTGFALGKYIKLTLFNDFS